MSQGVVTAMLSVADVAAHLKVSRYTVVRMVISGKLAASKVGRQWRIDPAAVDEMLRRTTLPAGIQ